MGGFLRGSPKGGKKFISVWEENHFGSERKSFRIAEKMIKAPVRQMLIRGFVRGGVKVLRPGSFLLLWPC